MAGRGKEKNGKLCEIINNNILDMDITDMPFMEMFDTIYPMNALFWVLIFVFVYVPLDVESETKETRRQIEEERKTL